jgi:hypothetical protein
VAQLTNGTKRHVKALKAALAAEVVKPQQLSAELGISGTTNWAGDVLSESNAELIHQSAYGQPGSRTWGEWETIVRTDPDVACALDFTAAQLRDARVDVKEADETVMPDRALAKAQADFVRAQLLEVMEPGWPEVIQQMTRGPLGYGFSLHEVVLEYGKNPSLPNGGTGVVLKKLAERLPVSIDINGWLEENGELVAVKQLGQLRDGRGFGNVTLPASKLLLVSWNRSGNNYRGFSAFRSVWYICKIRRHLLKLTGIALTREGAGIPTAVASDAKTALTPKQRRSLQKLLSNLVYHENAAVVMPAGWDLKWVFSPGANKGHVIEAWERLGMVILRQLSAQQVTLGSGATGSRSVGEVHNQVADAFAQGIIANIEGVLNGQGARPYTGLVRKLIDANWEAPAAYPKVSLVLKKAKLSPKEKTEAAKTAKDAGLLTVTLADENAIREDLGLAPIDEETREGEKKKAVELQRQMMPQGEPDEDDPKEPGKKPPPFAKKATRASRQPFMPRRALRAGEQALDLPAIDAFLDDQRTAFLRGALPLILEMLAKAAPDIRAAMADGDPSEVSTLKLDAGRLEKFIGRFLEKARGEGYAQVRAELGRMFPSRAASGDEKDPPAADDIEEETDTLIEAQRKQVTKKVLSRLRSEIEDRAIDVVRTGGDADEVVQEVVQAQLESTALERDAGLLITRAFNMGREEFAREHGDEVAYVELSAILDDGTCAYCEEHDGDEFDFGSPQHDEMTPPLRGCDGGPRCRCLLVYRFE